ncbi:MAG: sensor histidine kinase, partial [Planctomycetota bacterium]
ERIDVGGTKTELGLLARTLNEAFDRLQAAFERQAKFTADASHELRTPLSVIRCNAELALRRPHSKEEYVDALAVGLRAATRMQEIVDRLLRLARADADSIDSKRMPVDLGVLVREAATSFEPLAAHRGVSIHVETKSVVVEGDEDQLRDVLDNLLSNAVAHGKEGGRVDVRVRTEGDAACLEVEDDGPGIPAADLPHVFDRFYRVDRARSRARGGSGLGLSICRAIVVGHGGRIELESRPGAGTTVVVRLPKVAGGARGYQGIDAADDGSAGPPLTSGGRSRG